MVRPFQGCHNPVAVVSVGVPTAIDSHAFSVKQQTGEARQCAYVTFTQPLRRIQICDKPTRKP